jgi:hypothetical protein
MDERLFFMKTFTTRIPEDLFDLETQDVSECPVDAVELTEEELEQVTGSECGCGGWGGGFESFGPGFGFGGFHRRFAFSRFAGSFGRRRFW